jgi:hypothetical protein
MDLNLSSAQIEEIEACLADLNAIIRAVLTKVESQLKRI